MLADRPLPLPTYAELTAAFARLNAAGLLLHSPASVELSDAGRELARSVRRFGERRRAQVVAAALTDVAAILQEEQRWLTEAAWITAVEAEFDRRHDSLSWRIGIVEAQLRAVEDAENVGRVVRQSRDRSEARTTLMTSFGFSEIQANHILDTTLCRQTAQAVEEMRDEIDRLRSEQARNEEARTARD